MNEIKPYIRKIEKRMFTFIIGFELVTSSNFSKEGRDMHGYN